MQDIDICSDFFATANKKYGISILDLEAITNSISEEISVSQHSCVLSQNHPNPFNPETTISFSLNTENTEDTELIIYNIKGQKIRQYSIFNNQSSIIWDGTDENNQPVSSGIYFYKLEVDNQEIATKKCLLLK